VKQEKAVRKDITRKGGDGKTRAGARALRKAEVVEGDKDKEMVMGRVEAYYGRKRSIESIMSGKSVEESVEKTLESILTESDEDEGGDPMRTGLTDSDEDEGWAGFVSVVEKKKVCRKRKVVEKKKGCRKRKAGRKSLGLSSSSSSSSSPSSSESGSGEEAEIVDGTDVLEDEHGLAWREKKESKGTVIPSSLAESEEECSDRDEEHDPREWNRWRAACTCPAGILQDDCECDAGF
jgi:hypothetical protein